MSIDFPGAAAGAGVAFGDAGLANTQLPRPSCVVSIRTSGLITTSRGISMRFESSDSSATSASMLCAVTICGREPPSMLASATSRALIVGTSDHFSEIGPFSESSRPVARITASWMRGFQPFALKVAVKMPIAAIGRTTTKPITISRILRQRMEDPPYRACRSGERGGSASKPRVACSPRAAASLPTPSTARRVRQVRREHANVARPTIPSTTAAPCPAPYRSRRLVDRIYAECHRMGLARPNWRTVKLRIRRVDAPTAMMRR